MKKSLPLFLKVMFLCLFTLNTIGYLHAENTSSSNPMKNINNNDYPSLWQSIEELDQKDLPKSALKVLEITYNKAKAEHNVAQLVKAIIYKSKYTRTLTEDGLVVAIEETRKEIANSEFPAKQLLRSLVAEMYTKYLEQNRYRIQQRTQIQQQETTATQRPEDMKTWAIHDYAEKIQALYLASVDAPALNTLDIQDFKDILYGAGVDKLRPSLYDFLAHRALNYFSNERYFVTEPAYKFYLDQPQAFATAKSFVQHRFSTKDNGSPKLKALQLFQALTQAHLNDKEPDALLDVELKRLKFAFNNAVNSNKKQLYIEALEQLKQQYKQHKAVAEVFFYLAKHYQAEASQYQAQNGTEDPHKNDLKKAANICQQTLKRYPDAYGSTLCQQTLNQLQTAKLSLTTETVNPQQAFLTRLEYRNSKQVWLRIIPFSKGENPLQSLSNKERAAYLYRLNPIRTWTETLPAHDDYRSHSTELSIKSLPYGKYFIMVSNTESFTQQSTIDYSTLIVSDLAYIKIENDEAATDQHHFAVVDRITGAPRENVAATFYHEEYNSKKRENKLKKLAQVRSDKDGFFSVSSKNANALQLKLVTGDDELFLPNRFYPNHYSSHKPNPKSTHFFLDRAIYRPGQTVYFKAILITEASKNNSPRIHANQLIILSFFDANGQEIAKQSLLTNDYGSVSGHFIAPSNGLLGQMRITSNFGSSNHYFQVEEYKRPKFEVTFKPLTQSFRLNEKVTVKGNAKAFAGNNIDGATVKYRVTRAANYPHIPYWLYDRLSHIMSGNETQMAQGETKTNTEGEFSINFEAMADPSIDKTLKPEFSYRISVDVVDSTGETHSSNTNVIVGHIALRASISTAEKVHTDHLTSFDYTTTNLNGGFEAATGRFKVIALITPKQVYKKRYWEIPDSPLISQQDFAQQFPYFAYQDEDQVHNWQRGETVFDRAFDSKKSKTLKCNNKLPAGKYLLVLESKDKYDTAVKVEKIITVFDLKQTVPSNEFVWHTMMKSSFQPQEQAEIWVGSRLKRHLLLLVEKAGKIVEKRWINSDGLEKLSFAVEEKDRGNFFISISSVVKNRAQILNKNIIVPYSNKELKLSFNSFRDKLLPGAKEQWSLKITGNKKDKVAAEMVATLYDASLDQFAVHHWNMSPYPSRSSDHIVKEFGFDSQQSQSLQNYTKHIDIAKREYYRLNWFGLQLVPRIVGYSAVSRGMPMAMAAAPAMAAEPDSIKPVGRVRAEFYQDAPIKYEAIDEQKIKLEAPENKEKPSSSPVKIRTNLKETVFFQPQLKTDKDGNILINFTMNEALTRWNFLGLAHSKDLAVGSIKKTIVTQKDLMISPNPPRFFREGDTIEFTAKVSNLTEHIINGTAKLALFDAVSMQPVDELLANNNSEQNFSAKAGQSAPLSWTLTIPKGKVMAITHRVTAQSAQHSDGEESSLPVLSNRMLVTETMPLTVKGKSKKDFNFSRLANYDSNSLTHHQYTLSFTANPAWYAVQAMPYMMEYPHQCTEQVFNRFFANSLGTALSKQHPKIQKVFEQWKNSEALVSNLAKNQALKSALLAETPWVLEAQDETQQKKNIGLLFDLDRMQHQQQKNFSTIAERQLDNGGFAWFAGGKDDWYITQYLVENFGHLQRLGAFQATTQQKKVLQRAIAYIDTRLLESHHQLAKRVKKGTAQWDDDNLNQLLTHYLYARSFFSHMPPNKETQDAINYYLGQAERYWTTKTLYMQAMLALGLQRLKRPAIANNIVASLKERALHNDEMGMYWKYETGYWWYQLPIETHALMIEVFDEVAKDAEAVNDLKIWLLKHKQTNRWSTTKSTAAAVYALLNTGENWLQNDKPVTISLANGDGEYNQTIQAAQAKAEAGTGHFKVSWQGNRINKSMANISIDNPNEVVTWGAVYWQYFEDLDKITSFQDTPLKLKKQVFKTIDSDTGAKLTAIKNGNPLHSGDKLTVRIELRVDRDMEYIHMKDMRASGFEPLNVISRYKWQDGLGYYESTTDVATHFFFSYLPKGTYVFEYPVRVIHKGNFSNGITTIQSMYAPEFSSHSAGVRIGVE